MLDDKGIFCELENIANRYLLDPTWKRKDAKLDFGYKKNCLLLSHDLAPSFFNAEKMINGMFSQIESNISDRKLKRDPSDENWNFNIRLANNSSAGKKKESKKPEVTLERAIIKARRNLVEEHSNWTYQMPVASGIFGATINKSSNIDLVRRHSNGVFDLIELKVGSNNPVYAAVEILRYGLVYAASRKHALEIGYAATKLEILRAKQINLCVLAPTPHPSEARPFYDSRYKLAWLEKELNDSLIKFGNQFDFSMTFAFKQLDLDWHPTHDPKEFQLVEINDALDKMHPVTWGDTETK